MTSELFNIIRECFKNNDDEGFIEIFINNNIRSDVHDYFFVKLSIVHGKFNLLEFLVNRYTFDCDITISKWIIERTYDISPKYMKNVYYIIGKKIKQYQFDNIICLICDRGDNNLGFTVCKWAKKSPGIILKIAFTQNNFSLAKKCLRYNLEKLYFDYIRDLYDVYGSKDRIKLYNFILKMEKVPYTLRKNNIAEEVDNLNNFGLFS